MDEKSKFFLHAERINALILDPNGRPLKSGRSSPYFFNTGNFCSGSSLQELARMYASRINEHKNTLKPEVIFGPAYKGCSLAAVVCYVLFHEFGIETEFCHDRKEVKSHGEGGDYVGANMDGKNVVMIDDVITTGGTKDDAVRFITNLGGFLTGLVIAFDREERVEGNLYSAAGHFGRKYNLPVLSCVSFTDLREHVSQRAVDYEGSYPGIIHALNAYYEQYRALD